MKAIKDLKIGEYFTLKKVEFPTESQVWVRGTYDRSTRKFSVYRFDDCFKEKFLAAKKEVYIDFIF